MTKKNKAKRTSIIAAAVGILLALLLIAGALWMRNQKLSNSEQEVIYLPTGSTFDDAVDSLNAHHCIGHERVFRLMSRLRQYSDHVKPGCYKLDAGMNLWTALTKLYYGNQDPVRVTINKYRTKERLCHYLSGRLELDSAELATMLNDEEVCSRYGLTPATILSLFVQNTYEIYWNTGAEKLLERMEKESDRFWTHDREKKAKALNLSRDEVVTLASIVEEETNQNDEKADIASVYLNRLRKDMLLQADPTVKYAVGDFALRRILNRHTEVDNPYNTYRYKGLPPGPICIPSTASIDAVLENKQTHYLYFCARADFSGHHAFSATLAEHNANAAAFHAEMNRRKIYK